MYVSFLCGMTLLSFMIYSLLNTGSGKFFLPILANFLAYTHLFWNFALLQCIDQFGKVPSPLRPTRTRGTKYTMCMIQTLSGVYTEMRGWN